MSEPEKPDLVEPEAIDEPEQTRKERLALRRLPREPAAPLLTIDEFCARLSETDRRVELIAGFHAVMRARGKTKAAVEDYRQAFEAYRTAPVN